MTERTVKITIDVGGNAAAQLANNNAALRQMQDQGAKTANSMNVLKGALGALGVSLTARAAGDLARALIDQGKGWTVARSAVEATVGSLDTANRAIGEAQAATDGLVSRTNAAVAVNTFFRNGLASNAAEAGRLALAGQVLSNVYEAQGASFEKYIRFLSTGNIALADNFNLTMAQINSLSEQIQSTEGLSKAEADLAARKRLLTEAADAYNETMPEAVRASQELQTAWEDMAATISEKALPVLATAATSLRDILKGDALAGHAEAILHASDSYERYHRAMVMGGVQSQILTKAQFEQVKSVSYLAAGDASLAHEQARLNNLMGVGASVANEYTRATSEVSDATVHQNEVMRSLQGAYVGAQNALRSLQTSANATIVSARQSLNRSLENINRQAEDAERAHAGRVASIRQQIDEAANAGIEDHRRQLDRALADLEQNHVQRIADMRKQLGALEDSYRDSAADAEQEHQDDIDDLTQDHLDRRADLERQMRGAKNSVEKRALQQKLDDEDREYKQALERLERDYQQEVDRNARKHSDQVANLRERMQHEDAEYQAQQEKLKARAEEDMARQRAENAQRVAELQARLAEEDAAYQRQQADMQTAREEAHARFLEIQAEQMAQIAAAQEAVRIAREAWQEGWGRSIERVRNWWKDLENQIKAAEMAAGQTASAGRWGGWAGVTGFQHGTDFVPRTGMALLHRGEQVIPAGSNRGTGGGGDAYIIYAPAVSLGDRYEAERVLRPMLENVLRKSGR